jgi:glycine cleavage system H protein
VEKDDDVVVIESVKAASDIAAPIDGEIVEINQDIVDTPTLVNEDPLGKAWFFKMKPADMADLEGLMDEAAYLALIA